MHQTHINGVERQAISEHELRMSTKFECGVRFHPFGSILMPFLNYRCLSVMKRDSRRLRAANDTKTRRETIDLETQKSKQN